MDEPLICCLRHGIRRKFTGSTQVITPKRKSLASWFEIRVMWPGFGMVRFGHPDIHAPLYLIQLP